MGSPRWSSSLTSYRPQKTPRRARFKISASIPGQAAFWRDTSPVKGFVGGLGSGKTFAGAVEVLRQPGGSTGMVVAPTYTMMKDAAQTEFFSKICPPEMVAEHNRSEQITILKNHTRILWRSADRPDRLRGPNLGWVWVDEAAYVDHDAWRVIVGRVRKAPGRTWFTTTPNGQNWLYDQILTHGYAVHRAHTRDNPYNLATYAEDLAREYAHDPLYAAQELAGEFVDLTGSKRFPAMLISALTHVKPTATPKGLGTLGGYALPHEARIITSPTPGARYAIGVDCAEGVRGGDDSTAVVVEVSTGEVCAVLAGEYEPQEEHPALVALLARHYNNAPALVERNNHGHAVLAGLRRHNVPLLVGGDGRPGWLTTATSKADAYAQTHRQLLDAEAEGRAILTDARLADQLKGIDRTTLKGPGKGRVTKVDDEAVAFVLACVARARVAHKTPPPPAPQRLHKAHTPAWG